ncbi:Wadjet anti-phage system protein JetD domain-containing protein [Nocardioides ginsengisoli]|uniref:Wadjet anti-phage system protein JetD domain-containing protein n=1 Tax=Nocardioides ginsengisoli TaxID=363868 RepID=A0ABW3W6A9_9ACTN
MRTVTGLDDLALLPPHPARFHFTYLDSDHLDARGRQHDSYSVEDQVPLPYPPQVVLISENKDTAIGFPRMRGGVAIEGEGRGASTIASALWVRSAPLVVYWGDLDQDGLEILNEFRAKGLTITSMLMDIETYERYQRYGTTQDRNGKPIKLHPPRDVPHLLEHEGELYQLLTSSTAPVPRVEQERIPLEVAEARLSELVKLAAFTRANPMRGTDR